MLSEGESELFFVSAALGASPYRESTREVLLEPLGSTSTQ